MTTETPLKDFGIKVHVHAALGKPFYYSLPDARKFADAMAQVEERTSRFPVVLAEYQRLKAENAKLKAEVKTLNKRISRLGWFWWPLLIVVTQSTMVW